ncbi:type IV toxin-antitoxin system AbiEi family antitoxin domain-containing protein [Promicromonospora kroppenstedtii]|uniref:Type IV toxin-antitoxin system AbiEi family antitoxin domain-containing protein n=1 Tax=Promicromonospora kroppenstedtii TaxID=440482 RepID=A0ABW7XDT5_9MICO
MPPKLPVPPSLLDLARRQAGLVSSEQCDAVGVGPSARRNLVARGGWRRLTRGVYDTGKAPSDLHLFDVDRLRAAWTALLANRRAIAVGACGLVLHGVQGLPRRIAPEATFAGGVARKSRDGITFRQYASELTTVEVQGRQVVEIVQALVQALPTLSREQAVACLDSALHQGLINAEDLTTIRRRLVNRRGSRRVLDWLPLADGRAESPPESHARLRLHDAGIAPDDLQRDFFDERGRFLGRADLAWHLGAGRWLIVEIDSREFHGADRQVRHDAVRQNGLAGEGQNIVLRFFPGHVTGGHLAGEVALVLRREGWQPGSALPPRPARYLSTAGQRGRRQRAQAK